MAQQKKKGIPIIYLLLGLIALIALAWVLIDRMNGGDAVETTALPFAAQVAQALQDSGFLDRAA